MWWKEGQTLETQAGMRGRKKRPLLEKPSISPLSEKVAAAWEGSKEDMNTSADADLSSPEDLHQPITRAANVLDWWRKELQDEQALATCEMTAVPKLYFKYLNDTKEPNTKRPNIQLNEKKQSKTFGCFEEQHVIYLIA